MGVEPSTSQRLRVGIVAAVIGVVLAVVVLVTALIAGDDDGADTAQSGSSTSTVPASTSTGPASSTAPSAPVVPATTAPAPPGTVLTGAGSFLAPPPGSPTVQSTQPPTADCTALGDAGWTVECGMVTMAVKATDLTGDGRPELVFGFRSVGTGQYLSYDVVTDAATSGPTVGASRQGLAKGQATVAGGAITDYAAAYPNNEPSCCPPYFEKHTVQFSGGSFRLVDGGQVPQATGPFDL